MFHNFFDMIPDLFSQAGLSMERLRAFCLIAEAGGFTKAAGGDPAKQPLLSRQLKELEGFFGVELLRRAGRGVTLTEPGKELYRLARDYFSALGDFKNRCAESPTSITIGAGDSVIQWLILPRLEKTREALPNVNLRLLNLPTQEIVNRVANGEIELGIVRRGAAKERLKLVSLGRMDFALFIAKKSVPSGKPADWTQVLKRCPLAVLEGGGAFRQDLQTAAEKAGVSLRIEVECSSFPAVARAVQSAGLAAILPVGAAHELPPPAYVQIPLPWAAPLARELDLIWSPRVASIRLAVDDAARVLGKVLRA
jgi:DNA-binding transcriptional LysR family regulator